MSVTVEVFVSDIESVDAVLEAVKRAEPTLTITVPHGWTDSGTPGYQFAIGDVVGAVEKNHYESDRDLDFNAYSYVVALIVPTGADGLGRVREFALRIQGQFSADGKPTLITRNLQAPLG